MCICVCVCVCAGVLHACISAMHPPPRVRLVYVRVSLCVCDRERESVYVCVRRCIACEYLSHTSPFSRSSRVCACEFVCV